MKISESTIQFSSSHAYQDADVYEQTRTQEEKIRTVRAQSGTNASNPDREQSMMIDRVNISRQARKEYMSEYSASQLSQSKVTDATGQSLTEFNEKKMANELPTDDPPDVKGKMVLRAGRANPVPLQQDETAVLVAGSILGSEIVMKDVTLGASIVLPTIPQASLRDPNTETIATLDTTRIHYEAEQMGVDAKGKVTTKDGRTIDFSMELKMNRSYISKEQEQSITRTWQERARLVDPLTISLDGSLTQLSNTRFEFDLDNDGDTEQISFVSQGSGFLSFDINGDGKINNGSELFGPGTGNGFGELGAYDNDGNGWIDENDSVFKKLSVWTRDDQGNDHLISLKDAGMGAIYLDNAQADFDMTGRDNELKGRLRRSGVVLFENGNVGSIQQIDLADRTRTAMEFSGDEMNSDLKNPLEVLKDEATKRNQEIPSVR